MSNDSRRFSDEEFALVLRKALELQDGRTLPALVDRAVSLLPDHKLSGAERILGGPTRYRLDPAS